jgi:hypothetical protein
LRRWETTPCRSTSAKLVDSPGGRPRKEGARTKSGRLSEARKRNPELRDHGTKLFVAKRERMINGADPQLSATASGILLD